MHFAQSDLGFLDTFFIDALLSYMITLEQLVVCYEKEIRGRGCSAEQPGCSYGYGEANALGYIGDEPHTAGGC